ncbi:MAG: glycosyltransferase, partial [Gemmatimonadetes bacterium]|nr:glycosyltransferase [Gemmatimonadota bacterium]NIR81152.1 glycosyltransferase [Gemmatimonadota bacterium]NIT88229.1 glycosyltransferase [Gemmatimonadota bacterium]NIU33118.1 glycosyltransferase [Gemmatimonadota bacterium]NIU38015.1 glycosyltransferase [Gemmatimonadota bacterium]
TRTQALLLDGHFFLEQGGRYAAGRFFNFNGTAGIWRRSCLDEAGGWEADTLTEDLDLSYRAQMAGWRFVFLDDVGVPAEIPSRTGALEVQQRRWAQGGIQTARKLLPRLLRSDRPWPVKLEAVVHLCGHLAHPLTLALGLLLLPSALARRALGMEELLGLDLLVFGAATVPFLFFYGAAGRRRRRPWPRLLPDVVRTMALGVGLTAPVSRAVLRGLRSTGDGFVRTPKRGRSPRSAYGSTSSGGDTALKLALAGVMALYAVGAVATGFYASLPFIALFGGGWLALGLSGLRDGIPGAVRPGTPEGVPDEEGQRRRPEDDPEPEGLGPAPRLPERLQAPVAEECEAA